MSAGLFYLSFVDEARPAGQRFVGATVVHGTDDRTAFENAKAAGLVPSCTETAIVALYTQDDANQRVTSADMLPLLEAAMLVDRFATREEILGEKWKEIPQGLASYVCKDHT
jgi:hypothetical protein